MCSILVSIASSFCSSPSCITNDFVLLLSIAVLSHGDKNSENHLQIEATDGNNSSNETNVTTIASSTTSSITVFITTSNTLFTSAFYVILTVDLLIDLCFIQQNEYAVFFC